VRNTLVIASAFTLFLHAAPARADETAAKSRIVAVGLFKNGLAVVKREVTVGKAGTYVLEDVPEPVHGTYWIESAAPVESAVELREVEVPVGDGVPGNLQEDLAGKKVTIHFKGEKAPPTSGTVLKLKTPKSETARGRERMLRYGYDPGVQPPRFLVVQTAKGRTYVENSEIAYVESEGTEEKVKRRLPRLLLTVGDAAKGDGKVFVHYLTRGLSWAPSYRVDITDPKTLALEQHAVVKNELADLDGAEIKLISGFPSVQFAHVTSPLAARTSWAQFFNELNQRGWRDADATSNTIIAQGQFAPGNTGSPVALSLAATPAGEGVDLHYQSIGKRTLAEGDALALTVARGDSPYERIVEWLVPDTRNEYGQHVGRSGGESDESHDTAWDALKFKNPFAFPMTTGPATVTAGGKFNGQRTSYWVNAGEETVLHVNKALSVRTRAIEHEEQQKIGNDGRDFVWIGGRQFRRSTVEGELSVSNHRNEAIKLVIRRRFSGELLHADGDPKSTLREEGVYSVNKRNELLWTLPLKPGEERKLNYRYTVLVAH
jgi:hypothetical protein